jgi:hypothetical protein
MDEAGPSPSNSQQNGSGMAPRVLECVDPGHKSPSASADRPSSVNASDHHSAAGRSQAPINGQHSTSQGSIDGRLAAKDDTIAALHAQIMELHATSSEKDARIAYLQGALERATHTSADMDFEYQAFKRSQKEDATKVPIIPSMHDLDAHTCTNT